MSAVSAEFHGVVLPALTQVEALLRTEEAASGEAEDVGDAMRVLDSMQAGCDPKEWARAVKHRRGGKVVGKAAVIDAIGRYIGRYVTLWQSIKTIAESGDVMLMMCCAPGTTFHTNFRQLAAQSCRSQEVQIFVSWWAANAQRTD